MRGIGGPTSSPRGRIAPEGATSVTKSLQVKSENRRDRRQLGCFGGLPHFFTFLAFVRIEILRLNKPLEGGIDIGKLTSVGHNLQADVLDGVHFARRDAARSALHVRFDDAPEQSKGILFGTIFAAFSLPIIIALPTCNSLIIVVFGFRLWYILRCGTALLHGIDEQAEKFVRILLLAKLEPRSNVADEAIHKCRRCNCRTIVASESACTGTAGTNTSSTSSSRRNKLG
mmetsp:Transcript_2011/g.4464  ORF Transcript_2011/g.4464 Transcript_2011/m.4464 type:complete len:229 (+) Transcript_2011:916-1602(+)